MEQTTKVVIGMCIIFFIAFFAGNYFGADSWKVKYEDCKKNLFVEDMCLEPYWSCMEGCWFMQTRIYNVTSFDPDNESMKALHDACATDCWEILRQNQTENLTTESITESPALQSKPRTKNPTTLIAFTGDDDYNENSDSVYNLMKQEKIDVLVHTGDLHIEKLDKTNQDKYIVRLLNMNVPFIGVPGNHDHGTWKTYQEMLEGSTEAHGAKCTGDFGYSSVCKYDDITFVMSGVNGDADFIRNAFKDDDSTWKFCIWHENQNELQVGGKADEVGYDAYEACREAGAIIANGHTHTYARTYLMSNFTNQSIVNKDNDVVIQEGQSIVVTPSLGGVSIRAQTNSADNFASVYTSTQNATWGALFCKIYHEEEPTAADCYFKNVDNEIIDSFIMYRE